MRFRTTGGHYRAAESRVQATEARARGRGLRLSVLVVQFPASAAEGFNLGVITNFAVELVWLTGASKEEEAMTSLWDVPDVPRSAHAARMERLRLWSG